MFEDVDEGHVDGEEKSKFHYYYNREERIAHAPKIVQDYYNGGMRPQKGFKVLFKNKSNRFILLTLVFFIAFTWIYNGLNNTRNSASVGSFIFELQAFEFEEEIFVTLKSKKSKKSKDTEIFNIPVEVEVSFINNDNAVFKTETLIDTISDAENNLRTRTTDYDIIRIDAVVKVQDEVKELSTFVKR